MNEEILKHLLPHLPTMRHVAGLSVHHIPATPLESWAASSMHLTCP